MYLRVLAPERRYWRYIGSMYWQYVDTWYWTCDDVWKIDTSTNSYGECLLNRAAFSQELFVPCPYVLCVCLPVCLFVCVCLCLPVCLYVCPSVCNAESPSVLLLPTPALQITATRDIYKAYFPQILLSVRLPDYL